MRKLIWKIVSTFALLSVAAFVLAACGDKDRNKDETSPPRPVGQNNVFGDTIATKDRAREDVNKAMEQRQQQLEQSMKKQEQEAAAP